MPFASVTGWLLTAGCSAHYAYSRCNHSIVNRWKRHHLHEPEVEAFGDGIRSFNGGGKCEVSAIGQVAAIQCNGAIGIST